LWYRWNRGDLASIREVFVLEGYRLPVGFVPRTVLDLGANIGLTSIWLANNFPLEHLIAVEPVP
jgi:tRNA1(Val) A37 N6-methylase TrmN6